MRVLVVCMYSHDSCPLFSYEFAKGLSNNGCEVYAALPSTVENRIQWEKFIGEDHIAFVDNERSGSAFKKKVTKITNILKFELGFRKTLKNVVNQSFDQVYYMYFHRWNYLIKEHVKTLNHVMFVHDPVQHSGEAKRRDRMHYNQVTSMDSVIVMSKSFINDVKNIYGIAEDKIYHIPISIIDHVNDDKARKGCNYVEGAPIHFVFFGRIEPYKGVDVLIKAYIRIEKKYSNVSLTIAGSGDMTKYQELIEQAHNVEVVNRYIKDEEVDDFFLINNSVVIVPYVDATQSGIIVLAYSHGNPVISSRLPGLVEQLEDGKLGLLFEAGNDSELEKHMEYVIENSDYVVHESKKMRVQAEKMNWDYNVRLLLAEMVK